MKPANPVNLPRIFIIDNSIDDCNFMSRSLSQAGYRTNFSIDSLEGLTSILQNPPQCLIVNVILSGISGYAVCRQVRAIHPYNVLPIIVISTKNTSLDQNYSFKMGANYYLPKPFTANVLLQTVQKIFPNFSPITLTDQAPPSPAPQSVAQVSTAPAVSSLIPYRQDEVDIMLQNNPFARASVIRDGQLRQLYDLIDGSRTIYDLADLIRLDLKSTLKLLKMLWQQEHIVFYDTRGRLFKNISAFDAVS